VHLVLASQSPARLSTLRAAGVQPTVVVSAVDEDAVLEAARERFGELDPADAVLLLAQAKAEDVTRRIEAEAATADMLGAQLSSAVVVGCDSMLELDGEVRSKPVDAADAAARWRQQRGRSAVLHTGHWLIDLRAAGAFTIDGLGGPYVERLEGDPHGVVGLSLPLLRELLEEIDVPFRALRG